MTIGQRTVHSSRRVKLALALLFGLGVLASTAPLALAGAGTTLPGGGYAWYDQYAQGFLDSDRGTVVMRFDPVGRMTSNDPFSYEFSGPVDAVCTDGNESVYIKGNLPYEFDPADTSADGQFLGTTYSDSCGVEWYYVLKASLTNTTPYEIEQEPSGTCPAVVPQVNGCYYMTRESMTPVGATALVKFWWCGPQEPTEAAECKKPSRLAAVAREGQVKMGKEVVLTTAGYPTPELCEDTATRSYAPPEIVECVAETLPPIMAPDPRDCLPITTTRQADIVPDCLEE